MAGMDDRKLLVWATANERVLLTHDLATMVPALLVQHQQESGCTPNRRDGVGFGASESGLFPLVKPNRSLTQDFLYEGAVDTVTCVGIRNPHLKGALPHELMPAPWDRPLEAKTPETADQLSPGDRFRHASRGSGR
jgi:hypothetical protein